MYLRASLFYDVMWHWLIYGCLRCVTFRFHVTESSSLHSEVEVLEEYCLRLECRADRLCRNISNLVPTYAAQHPQKKGLQYAAVEPALLQKFSRYCISLCVKLEVWPSLPNSDRCPHTLKTNTVHTASVAVMHSCGALRPDIAQTYGSWLITGDTGQWVTCILKTAACF
jgi:hypothetical protein